MKIADISLAILRKVDVMCRYGGEEFVVLLPETEVADAAHAAERMCTAISSLRLKTEKGDVSVSVSIGVAEMDKSRGSFEKVFGGGGQGTIFSQRVRAQPRSCAFNFTKKIPI